MKKPKVVAHKNLPTRLPVVGTIAWYLLLDRINAPGWVWGAIGVLFFVFWVVSIISLYLQESTEVFKD